MKVRYFYRAIIFRLSSSTILTACSVYLYFNKEKYFLSALCAIAVIIFIVNTIIYFNNINRWIAFFLMGIENEDASLKIPHKTGSKVIDEVFKGLDRLNEIFKNIKAEIGTQEQYFKSVLNQSATGLFSVNQKGRIININPSAEKLTGLKYYYHINALNSINKALPEFIMDSECSQKSVSAIFENNKGQKILFKVSAITIQLEEIKLIAASDITKELDNREIDSWIKLARTLSHEIMNNITPITTLSNVISGYYTQNGKTVEVDSLNQNIINNTVKGLDVIEERSIGLMKFVDNYRQFTKLPEPEFKQISLAELIDKILMVCSGYEYYNQIKIIKSCPKDIVVETDPNLFSQVLVNIIKNAVEAMQADETCTEPQLTLNVCTDDRTCLLVSNNGEPIPPEIREQIFVPFYTTKETGSGIGLSLSKQIMIKMGGDIILKTENNTTCFHIYT